MGQIVISGASGDLGKRVTQLVLEADPHQELTLVTRTPQHLRHLEQNQISVAYGDYQDRSSLERAYQGADVLFAISGLNLGRRVEEHRNLIAAAKSAGVRHVVYTSVGGVQPNNPALSAIDHHQTELDFRTSGLHFTFLRNHLYAEIVSRIWLGPAAESGRLEMATGQGSLAPVAKADVARAAAVVLLNPDRHAGAVYDITGPELLSMEEITRIGSEIYGTPITYNPVTQQTRQEFFDSLGMPRTYHPDNPPSPEGHHWASDELVSADVAIAQGYQALLTHHVEQITGQKPQSLRQVMERVKSLRYDQIDASIS